MSEFRRRLESETDPWVKSVGKVLQDILEEEAYKRHVLRRLAALEQRRKNVDNLGNSSPDTEHLRSVDDSGTSREESKIPRDKCNLLNTDGEPAPRRK